MKNLKLFIPLAVALLLISCKKDVNEFYIQADIAGGDYPVLLDYNENTDAYYVQKGTELRFYPVGNNTTKHRWTWDFGNGNKIEAANSVDYTYTEPGEYSLSLTIDNGKESLTDEVKIYVTGYAYKFTGNFTGTVQHQSQGCGTSSESLTMQIESDLYSDSVTIHNLCNLTDTVVTVAVNSSVTFNIVQQNITFKDGTIWDITSAGMTIDGLDRNKYSYSMVAFSDANHLNLCGTQYSDMNLSK